MGWWPALLFQLGLSSRPVGVPEPGGEETPAAEPTIPTGGGGGGGSGRLGSGIYRPIKLRPRVRFKDKRYDDYALQIDEEDAVVAMIVMNQ